jgi:hypothetical protein
MFSSIANYINSLVVLAKFYFADNPVSNCHRSRLLPPLTVD